MRKIQFFLVLIFALLVITAKADEREKAPPGMEIIQIGDTKHLVPKGTRIRKEGGVVIFEGQNEYMSRKFTDIDKRLDKIDREIEQLKKTIDKRQVNNLIPKEIIRKDE